MELDDDAARYIPQGQGGQKARRESVACAISAQGRAARRDARGGCGNACCSVCHLRCQRLSPCKPIMRQGRLRCILLLSMILAMWLTSGAMPGSPAATNSSSAKSNTSWKRWSAAASSSLGSSGTMRTRSSLSACSTRSWLNEAMSRLLERGTRCGHRALTRCMLRFHRNYGVLVLMRGTCTDQLNPLAGLKFRCTTHHQV